MKIEDCLAPISPAATCMGTGLLALDVLLGSDAQAAPQFWAGGSCGNVLTIWSYLGWTSYPLARLGNDRAGSEVVCDLERWGVRTPFVVLERDAATPIIVERIEAAAEGVPKHRFERACPHCGAPLPRFRPLLVSAVNDILSSAPQPDVFFFDRVSPSSLRLAKAFRDRGSLIVFEPSAVKDPVLFAECVKAADILKYSFERFSIPPAIPSFGTDLLEIQTLGSEGLRYRRSFTSQENSVVNWTTLPAYHVEPVRDTAGSGDWCTAGMVHSMFARRKKNPAEMSATEIEECLNLGQAYAAINCCFEGARGGMYRLSRVQLCTMVSELINGVDPVCVVGRHATSEALGVFEQICPQCANK